MFCHFRPRPPCIHFKFCGVAGSEQVPLALLGWYYLTELNIIWALKPSFDPEIEFFLLILVRPYPFPWLTTEL